MQSKIDFSKPYEYQVKVYESSQNTLGDASLFFGENELITLKFNLLDKPHYEKPIQYQSLKVQTEHGDVFSLLECELSTLISK